MPHTRIITTIGPTSLTPETLSFFAAHSVELARLNFSHGQSEWHVKAGQICRSHGLQLLIDLGGPKIRTGEMKQELEVATGQQIILEKENVESGDYPRQRDGFWVIPTAVDLSKDIEAGRIILVDDGKISLKVDKIQNSEVFCTVTFGGPIKSRKGLNMPGGSLNVEFLTKRDREMLRATLPELKPEVVACSFVRSVEDILLIKNFIQQLIEENGLHDYFPKICAKIEQYEAVQDGHLEKIVAASDLIMIARGDLALEVAPVHIQVPFYQEKIKRVCREQNKPFVVATQILESMINSPVPTRAEISDLYRAVITDTADYVMLSGESAVGSFARECVTLMHTMIMEQKQMSEQAQKV
jgi:pyruvate kinase